MANPITSPIHLSTTFKRNVDGSYNDDFVYSSINNPNRKTLEDQLTKLENGKVAFAFASGMAAIHAVFQSLKAGDHVIIPQDTFFQVRRLIRDVFERWTLEYTIVNPDKKDNVQKAVRDNTKLIWLETPSNPLLEITDIQSISEIAKKNNCLLVVDSTWATPILQNPLDLGADIVMHSTTKYFGGHHDVIGGCLVLREAGELADQIGNIQKLCGGVPSPLDCWLISRGIKTLRMRVLQQSVTALQLAFYLQEHPEVIDVYYPGLKSHSNHQVAKKQMKNGFGGMLSILLKGTEKRALEVSNKLRLFTCATSLGGVDSLVEHRKSVEGADSRAPENLLRISVGVETFDELSTDWKQALS